MQKESIEYEDLRAVESIGEDIVRLWLDDYQAVDVVVFKNPTEPNKGEPRFSITTKIGGLSRKQLSGLISGLCYIYNHKGGGSS